MHISASYLILFCLFYMVKEANPIISITKQKPNFFLNNYACKKKQTPNYILSKWRELDTGYVTQKPWHRHHVTYFIWASLRNQILGGSLFLFFFFLASKIALVLSRILQLQQNAYIISTGVESRTYHPTRRYSLHIGRKQLTLAKKHTELNQIQLVLPTKYITKMKSRSPGKNTSKQGRAEGGACRDPGPRKPPDYPIISIIFQVLFVQIMKEDPLKIVISVCEDAILLLWIQ